MKKILCLLLCLILSTSCATIRHRGNNQTLIPLKSNPPAKVTITNRKGKKIFVGQTPTFVKLKTARFPFLAARYTLTFEKEGYQSLIKTIKTKVSPLFVANILNGVLIGAFIAYVFRFLLLDPMESFYETFPYITGGSLIIDGYTGTMYEIKEENVEVILQKLRIEH